MQLERLAGVLVGVVLVRTLVGLRVGRLGRLVGVLVGYTQLLQSYFWYALELPHQLDDEHQWVHVPPAPRQFAHCEEQPCPAAVTNGPTHALWAAPHLPPAGCAMPLDAILHTPAEAL